MHRLAVLAVTPLAALALAVPASAQESPSPSPRPTQSPHVDRACPFAEFDVDRRVIRPGETVSVTARRFAQEGQSVELRLTRLAPAPTAVVRSDTGAATVVTWSLRLGESHTVEARYFGQDPRGCMPLGRPDAALLRVDVQPDVSIAAARHAPRDYTFTGRVLPARGQSVTLYRHEGARRIITARGVVGPGGTYRIDRRFTGSGQFGFSVAVPASSAHLAGQSRVRPTVIH